MHIGNYFLTWIVVYWIFSKIKLLLFLFLLSIHNYNPKQSPLQPSSITQLCSTKYRKVFEGDVLALYGPAQSRSLTSPTKTHQLHIDLVEKEGQMTTTIEINNHLIPHFVDPFHPGTSVMINEFGLK